MTLFILMLLLAVILLLFIPIEIRVIHGKTTEVQIEIQPFCIVLKKEKKENGKKNKDKKRSTPRDILYIIRHALPSSKVTLFKLDVSVFSDELFSLYTNTGAIWASLYPALSYVALHSKELNVEDGALECTPATETQNKTSISVDIAFELALYSVIRVIIDYFLFRKRRKKHARRN